MALIKCPECGKEISDKAASCPNCGYPLRSTNVRDYENDNHVHEDEEDYEDEDDDDDKRPTSASIIGICLGILAIILKSKFICFIFAFIFIYDMFANHSFKRKLYIVTVILLIIAFWLTGKTDNTTADSDTYQKLNSINENRKKASQKVIKETVTATQNEESTLSEEEFKEQCIELNYEEIMRNPDDYMGQKVKVTVKVFQSCKAGIFSSTDTYYKTFTNNDSGNWMGDMIWLLDYRDSEDEHYTKILDDDIITAYGIFNGLGETKNTLNNSKSEDMKIDMLYAEINQ